MQELLYTSAPKGLKPGSRGFCTVLSSAGMAAPVASTLESLSGYRPVFSSDDPRVSKNPIVFSHLKVPLNGRRTSVLSRIADYGLDYSQRTNKLAHHVVLEPGEWSEAGPASLLSQSGFMRESWDGELKVVSGNRPIPNVPLKSTRCQHWEAATGDAGWAGVLAESFLKDPERIAYLIYEPGAEILPLIQEAVALLPKRLRWDVTFSTYFTKLPKGATCAWRCLVADTPEAHDSLRYVRALRIDLTQSLGKATGGALVDVARTGKLPQKPSTAASAGLDAPDSPIPEVADDSAPLRTQSQTPDLPPTPHRPPRRPRQQQSQHPRKKPDSSTKLGWMIAAALLLLVLVGGAAGWMVYGRKSRKPGEGQLAQAEQSPPEVHETVSSTDSSSPSANSSPEQTETSSSNSENSESTGVNAGEMPEKEEQNPQQDGIPGSSTNQETETGGESSQQAMNPDEGQKKDSHVPKDKDNLNHNDELACDKKVTSELSYKVLHLDLTKQNESTGSKFEVPFSSGPPKFTEAKFWQLAKLTGQLSAIGPVIKGKDFEKRSTDAFSIDVAMDKKIVEVTKHGGFNIIQLSPFTAELIVNENESIFVNFHSAPTIKPRANRDGTLLVDTGAVFPDTKSVSNLRCENLTLRIDGQVLQLSAASEPVPVPVKSRIKKSGEVESYKASLSWNAVELARSLAETVESQVGVEHKARFEKLVNESTLTGTITASPVDGKIRLKLELPLEDAESRLANLIADLVQSASFGPTSKLYSTLVDNRKISLSTTYPLAGTPLLSSSFGDHLTANLQALDSAIDQLGNLKNDQKRMEAVNAKVADIQKDLKQVDELKQKHLAIQQYREKAIKVRDAIKSAEIVSLVITQEATNGTETKFVPFIYYNADEQQQEDGLPK